MNPRIEIVAPGITREAIAEQIHLYYDPATKSANVAFQYRPSLYVNDEFKGPAGEFQAINVGVVDIAATKFGSGLVDPVTGESLANVSGAGIVVLIKAAFPQLYDAQLAAIAEMSAGVA